jgi:hypothetical protein
VNRFKAEEGRGKVGRARLLDMVRLPLKAMTGTGKSVLGAEGGENSRDNTRGNSIEPMPPRKSSLLESLVPVPQTDTGGQG